MALFLYNKISIKNSFCPVSYWFKCVTCDLTCDLTCGLTCDLHFSPAGIREFTEPKPENYGLTHPRKHFHLLKDLFIVLHNIILSVLHPVELQKESFSSWLCDNHPARLNYSVSKTKRENYALFHLQNNCIY